MMARIVFMGSPEFGVPSLRALQEKHSVVGVVTQPDRPAGRGRGLRLPAVKVAAQNLDLPVYQPESVNTAQAIAQIGQWGPELIVVAAFGQILKSTLLELPEHGCVNVHASLLPRWRGAAPIQAAILAGDTETGITVMKMDSGMDTGAILSQWAVPIEPADTGGTLSAKLSDLGARALLDTLPAFLNGDLRPRPQDPSLATKAPLLKKADGFLNPSVAASQLDRQVRAFAPWPGTFVIVAGERLNVRSAHVSPTDLEAGEHAVIEGLPALGTPNGALVLDEVQPPGKRVMSGQEYLRGARTWNI